MNDEKKEVVCPECKTPIDATWYKRKGVCQKCGLRLDNIEEIRSKMEGLVTDKDKFDEQMHIRSANGGRTNRYTRQSVLDKPNAFIGVSGGYVNSKPNKKDSSEDSNEDTNHFTSEEKKAQTNTTESAAEHEKERQPSGMSFETNKKVAKEQSDKKTLLLKIRDQKKEELRRRQEEEHNKNTQTAAVSQNEDKSDDTSSESASDENVSATENKSKHEPVNDVAMSSPTDEDDTYAVKQDDILTSDMEDDDDEFSDDDLMGGSSDYSDSYEDEGSDDDTGEEDKAETDSIQKEADTAEESTSPSPAIVPEVKDKVPAVEEKRQIEASEPSIEDILEERSKEAPKKEETVPPKKKSIAEAVRERGEKKYKANHMEKAKEEFSEESMDLYSYAYMGPNESKEKNVPKSFTTNTDGFYNDTEALLPPQPDVIKRTTLYKVVGGVLAFVALTMFLIYYY